MTALSIWLRGGEECEPNQLMTVLDCMALSHIHSCSS